MKNPTQIPEAPKKEWSRKKDRILSNYLEPYLAKVKNLGKPILIVDAFAGPGKYGDSELGSPLIICPIVADAIRRYDADIRVLCIERHKALYKDLVDNIAAYPFAEAKQGSFIDHLEIIKEHASRGCTILLYADPYRPADVDIRSISELLMFAKRHDLSVELLLNFIYSSFHRHAWKVLKENYNKSIPSSDIEWDDDFVEEPQNELQLDQMVDGGWWKEVLTENPKEEQSFKFMEEFKRKLHDYFVEVCYIPVREGGHDSRVKYYLVFGSRHIHALLLMNDIMLDTCGESDLTMNLFATVELENTILGITSVWTSRGQVVSEIIRTHFCRYKTGDIKKCIQTHSCPR